jgi:hypothetical protein
VSLHFGDGRLAERFWDKVAPEPMTGCWLWTAGADRDGYGHFWLSGRTKRAHRVAYEAMVGPVPVGLELDHVQARGCSSRACVNPAHLEPVTTAVNASRERTSAAGLAAKHATGRRRGAEILAKTCCPSGHPYSGANLHIRRSGARSCRACNRVAMAARRAAVGR